MISGTTALDAAGLDGTGAVPAAVESRTRVFEMTQEAEDAVLRPRETGAWSHALRGALAARIATLNAEPELAARYAAAAGACAALADPQRDGAAEGLSPVLAFMDKVAARTRDVAAEDIAALHAAGIEDADIVRLCELNAFLAYQIRVIAGLRLMQGATP
jgi:uncharacterized protein YciW